MGDDWWCCIDVPQLPGGNNVGGGCWRRVDKAEGGGGGGESKAELLLLLEVNCCGTFEISLELLVVDMDAWLPDSPIERPWCWCGVSEGDGIWL